VGVLEGSDKLARDAFVHSVKVFTSLVLFYAFIINYNRSDQRRIVSRRTESFRSTFLA